MTHSVVTEWWQGREMRVQWLQGLPGKLVRQQSKQLLEQVRLTAAGRLRSGSYSGGMKRRLSVACALLGDPHIVFLDEPTTGMDPISRRHVWDIIETAKAGHSSAKHFQAANCACCKVAATACSWLLPHAQHNWSGICSPMVTCKCRAGYCADNTQYGGGGCAGGPHCHHGTRPLALHWLIYPSQAPLWLWLPGLHQACMHSLPAAIATLSIMSQTHPGDYSSGNMHNKLLQVCFTSLLPDDSVCKWGEAEIMCQGLKQRH